MRIIEALNTTDPGVPLGKVAFGTVVRLAKSSAYYLVISKCDGSGTKHLVTLGAGTLKDFPEDTHVMPVDAELRVFGLITSDSIGWDDVVPPWYKWPREYEVRPQP